MLRRLSRAPIALLVSALLLSGCSVNPATGRNQLNFFGEESEIEMGREADAEIVGSVGLYDDPLLQDYVHDLGMEIAAKSERPNLPWSFKILDDPAVNAFALPGGFVYVTRGLMTHLSSEAELVAVLGHEAGHVTARHGVNQMSKQILASVGLGVAVLANPDLEDFAFLGEVGLSLVFLKYSRDDERQADDLGLRYAVRTGYDPHQMPEVFRVLDAVSKVEGVGRLPNWLSTHPDPGVRAKRIEDEVAALEGDFSSAKVERDSYLARLDGMVFGDNPREGYFQGNAFLHPDLRFRIDFPEGWETSNQKDAVTAADPDGKAMVQVSASGKDTRDEAEEEFFSEEGITQGKSWDKKVHGLPASWSRFEFKDEDSDLRGTVAFVEHGDSIFQVMTLSQTAGWDDLRETLEETIASFSRLDDPKALQTRPYKLKVVRLDSDMTVESFAKKYPSDVPLATVALINHVEPGGTLRKGQIAKRVVAQP
ncbi:MAG TPA: M48 family metalloprotease [Thermoanaerobaculia bacterium]|jgi:predicted Zn-dependent protease|nr:M48 family metalloprotease [Thermoanaerobaculia bacterium]